MKDKRDTLYDNLLKSGKVSENEIGTRDQFKKAINNQESANQFHKNLLSSGLTENEIGDSNSFYKSIASDFTNMDRFVTGKGDKTTIFGVPYGTFKRLKPEHKQYYYNKAVKAEKLAQANEIEARATKESGEAYNRLENRQESSRKENPILSALSAGAGEMAGFTTPYQAVANPEIAASSAALNQIEEAREVIATSDRKDKTSTSKELERGFVNKAKKLSTWDFGATDVSDNKALLFAAQKKQRGEQTTPAEDALLESAALTAAVHGDFDKDVSTAYNIGEGAATTVSYMKDFLLTGGLQGLGRVAVKKFGTEAAKKTIAQIAKNAALRAGGDLVGAAGMAATVHAGQTAADAMDRMTGDVIPTFDKDGNAQFDKTEGGESGGKALAKAFGNTVIEDYSEMFGEYFSPINKLMGKTAGKVADKIGLKKVHEAIASIPSSDWGKAYNHFTEQTHWNGFTGEYGEELVGTAMNAAFVGDSKFSDLIDPEKQKETFLSVALMSGVMGGANIVGYRTPKYRAGQNLKRADKEASSLFGERWESLKEDTENADNEELIRLSNQVLGENISMDKKKAFAEYTARLQAYHGTNLAEVKRQTEGEVSEDQLQLENSYNQGTNIIDPAERKAAKDELDSIASNLSEEEVSLLNSYDSLEDYYKANNEAEEGSPFVTTDTALNYFNAKAKYDGMIDAVRGGIEEEVTNADITIQQNTHKDGNIYEIRLKTDDKTPYYIIDGLFAFDENGFIDKKKSDEHVIVRSAEGNLEMRPVRDIEKLYSQDSAEQLRTATAQKIREQESEKAANEIEGVRDFAQDEVVTINTPEGLKEVVVNGVTPEGNYEVVSTDNSPIINGEVATVLDKKQLSQMENEAKKVPIVDQSEEADGMAQQDNTEAVTQSVADTNLEGTATEQISNAPIETSSNVSEVQSENESTPPVEQNNLSNEEQPVPLDDDGEPIFHQMPVEQSASLLSELDQEDSFLIIDNNINALSKEVDKLSKTKPKSTSFNKIKAEREEIKGRLAEAQTKLDYWNNLKDVITKPINQAPVNTESNTSTVVKRTPASELNTNELDFENNIYVIHQTDEQNAENISKNGLSTKNGLNGTSLLANKETIQDAIKQMQEGRGHRGSTQLVIMSFPKSDFQNGDKIQLDDISIKLADKGYGLDVVPKEYISTIVDSTNSTQQQPITEEQPVKTKKLSTKKRAVRYAARNTALGEYMDLTDYLLRSIATGQIKFKWKTKGRTKGLGQHLGLTGSQKEFKDRFNMLTKDEGSTPEQVAESLFGNIDEYLLNGYTEQDVFNEILRIFQTHRYASDMMNEAEKRHNSGIELDEEKQLEDYEAEQEAEQEREEIYSELVDGIYSEYEQTLEEIVSTLKDFGVNEDELINFSSIFDMISYAEELDKQEILDNYEQESNGTTDPGEGNEASGQRDTNEQVPEAIGGSQDGGRTEENQSENGLSRKESLETEPYAIENEGVVYTNLDKSGLLIDNEGNALLIYHGTTSDQINSIEDLSVNNAGKNANFNGTGIYLTPNKSVALDYSEGNDSRIISGHVRFKKPFIVYGTKNLDEQSAKEFTNNLKEQGYDGIIVYPSEDMRLVGAEPSEVIVFGTENLLPTEQQKTAKEASSQVDAEIAKIEKQISEKKKEYETKKNKFGKALSEDNQGSLFPIEEQVDKTDEGSLFKVARDVTQKNANTILSPIQDEITVLERDKKALQEGKQKRIDDAIKANEAQLAIQEESEKVNTNPTEAQKEAGNYKMGHVKVQGFDITLENPKDSERSGTDADGNEWSITMNNHYGYFRGTEGKDGDHIDTFIGDNLDSDKVFVVDQVNKDGSFDEHKVMLGFNTMEEAKAAYLSNYEEGWQGLGGITESTVENFRKWADTDTRKVKPFADYKEVKESSITPVEEQGDVALVKASDGVVPIKKRSVSQQPKKVDVGDLFGSLKDKGEAKLSDHVIEEQVPEEKPTNKSKWVDEEDYEEFANLRDELRKTMGSQLNAGVDPKIILLGGRMSYLIMKHGVRKFNEYAKAMIEEIGDAIRPHLQGLYEFARLSPEVKESGWANELTSHDEVVNFDIDNFDKIDTTPEIQKAEPKAEKTEEKEPESQGKSVSSEQEKLKTEKNGKEQKRGSKRENTPVGKGEQQEAGGLERTGLDGGNAGNTLSDKSRSGRVSDVRKSTEKLNKRNNRNERGVNYAPKSPKARFNANIAAIKLMKDLVDKGTTPTEEQMQTLRKYSGWGGLGGFFNQNGTEENRILKQTLDAEEYDAAVMSLNSAYYTPASVIDTLWDAAGKLGFKGGNILEGSAGIGSIIGSMPQSMSEKSNIEAVEIDKVSGSILKLLYPDAKVNVQGFEDTNISNNSVDLAITNVPFVTGLKVFDKVDKDLSKIFSNIHDFCIAKNIRKLKEGGIGIFITSNGTLDKSKKLREWITSNGNADVVGAFRMNNKTFEGTNATSDIIIVRKRVNGKKFDGAIDVLNTSVVRTAAYKTGTEWSNKKHDYVDVTKDVAIEHNTYFQQHPENMAGKMQFGFENNDTFRPESVGLYPVNGMNQEEMLKNWIESLSPAFGSIQKAEVKETESTTKREGTLFIDNSGDIAISQYGNAVSLGVNNNKVKGKEKSECLNDYIAIKEALQAVLDNQSNNEDDKGLKPLLKKLNNAYDTFVSKYGQLNSNTSISFLKNDVDFPTISAIEDYKEVKNMDGTVDKQIKKTAVFNQRVVGFKTEPEPKNLPDAIIASVYKFGNIDVPYIADKLGMSENDVKREIVSSKKGFVNPSTGLVEVRHEYLSGNVREKLELAKAANTNGEYNGNIESLEKVIPMDIPAHLIDFSLGSSWLDKGVYKAFMKEKTGVECNIESVEGAWIINPEGNLNGEKNREAGVYSAVFEQVIPGHTLLSAALNNKSVAVKKIIRHYDKTTETVYDKDATQACTTRIAELKDEFKEWMKSKISENEDLAERVMRKYNDKFNCIVPKSIDEEFLPERFEGATVKLNLYAHQKKAVVRATTEPLMLAHEVGTGKTFTLISTAMEMRRLGTAKKPMVVVQNSTVGQFVSSAKQLYPNAKILTLTEKDRTADGRKAFYAKIKYNDWDIIVVPQSTFEKIPDSPEWQNFFINEKIEDKIHALEAMKEMDVDSRIIDALESELEALQEELIQVSTGEKKDAKSGEKAVQNAVVRAKEQLDRNTDDVEFFDQMDIDAILVDEAHEYKRLGFATTMTRGVKGIDPAGSKKAAGVYIKTRAVLEKNGWKNVVFATGTPISNTAAEIWTFIKYLMPKEVMKANDIYYFDDFVRNFGSIMQSLEFATNGQFKENTRFASYINKPELIRLWASVTDTVLTKDVDYVNDKVPEIEGGKAQDVYLPQSDSLIDIMNAVRKQLQAFEEMTGKEKKANSHIPLTMYGIAKRAAIDPRLVDKNAKDEPESKTNKSVDEIVKSLEETKDYKGTVAVFCDNQRRWDYVDGKKVAGFDLFEEMKRKLVDKGVDESQIVIMKSGMTAAKKEKLFADVNSGNVRVVIGNTQTLGTGVNIQERLHTLIHMDAPDRPMDYTQRNGRILRQGNMHKQWNKPVRILRFGVEDSLDVTSYQRLKTKAGFIDSIMDGKSALTNNQESRTLEEEEEGLFDNPVAVLSGSEYALKKNQAEREYRKYSNKKTQYENDQVYITNKLRKNKGQANANEGLLSKSKERIEKIHSLFPTGKVKTVKIEGKKCSNETEIESALKELVNKPISEKVEFARGNGRYNGETVPFKISLDGVDVNTEVKITRETNYDDKFKAFRVTMHKDVTYSIDKLGLENVPVSGGYVKGALTDILDNVITGKDAKEAIEVYERANARMQEENELMSKRSGKPFEFDNELNQAKEKVSEYTTLMKQELDEKNKKYEGRGNSEAVELSTETEEEEDNDTRYRTSMYSSLDVTINQEEAMDEINSISESLNTPVRIITNVEEITDSNGKRELSKRDSKGWFDTKTGEIVVVLPNADSIEDARRTILHEVVAHKGLRNMFGKEFDSFLGQVYDNATPEIRKKINSMAAKHGWNINIATEEYLASLSEKGFEDKQEQTLWRKIKQAFVDMIHKAKINLGYNISDEDLRYILWKSYQKLQDGSPIMKNAEDAAMKDKLFRSSKAPKHDISNVTSEANNSDVLFRKKEEPVTPENLIQTYDDKFKKKMLGINVHKFKEAYQDSMLALKDLQELISKSTGKEIKDHENAYIAENQLSSKGAVESEFYKDNYFKPMIAAINALTKKGKTYKEVIDYMVAKHGLERNEVMAKRDADKWAEEAIETANKMALNGEIDSDQLHEMMDAISNQIEEKYEEFRKKDYSGLTQLTGDEEGYEAIAQDMVDAFETGNSLLVYKLWKDVNAATKQTLLKSYTSGLMSKSTYEKVRDMFENYIPLRGWDDTIASDVYDYILSERSTFNAPVKSAQGRSSLADDPIAVIANMADSAILQGNRNLMKQKFLNMVLNHPNDLAMVRDMWYENKGTEENPIWAESFPDIKPDATPEEISEAIEAHEERMSELVNKGMASKARNGLHVGYRTNAKERNEHIIVVKRGGKEQAIFINGNPRAAQAINGLTNPDATDHKLMKTIQWINRQMAANFTTRNPAFVLTNMSRDLIFSTTAIDVKENGKYSRKFKKNVAKNISQIAILMAKRHNGTLDMNKETERLFSEFIQNGGETGYTALKSVDDYKKIVSNELLKAKGKTDLGSIIGLEVGKITTPTTLGIVPAFRALSKWTEFGNRCAEDISRFSTYMTSRQMGRSVQQSINDAKEVTVNFNKKGAGGYMGATTIKSLFLFFNAAVQSLNNLCKLAKKSPVKFSGAIGSFTAAGLLIPLMNNLLMAAIGGDDDKDAYNNLPEWVRRNNLCLFVGNKKFITIPLPIELRAFYGIGEMAYQYSAGNMKHRNMGIEMLNQISGLIPLDPTGGSNSLIPDAVKPIAQVLENKDFYDKPIYKKFDYNEFMPEYTKAYAGTSNWLIRSAEFLNNETGGNKYKPGTINLNPAIEEHLFEGYFGGMAKTVNQTAKTIGMIWNDDERVVRNVPIVNRFVSSSSDERNAYSRINEEYYKYKNEYELTKQQVNGFNKEEKKGVFDYAKEVDFIHNSKEYQRYEIFKDHEKTIKSLQDDIKIASGEEKKQLEKMLNIEKTQLVEQMAETE